MGWFSKKEEAPGQFTMNNGELLRCHSCRNDEFYAREGQLNTAAATFLNFDWANHRARCIVCASCGFIHWFY